MESLNFLLIIGSLIVAAIALFVAIISISNANKVGEELENRATKRSILGFVKIDDLDVKFEGFRDNQNQWLQEKFGKLIIEYQEKLEGLDMATADFIRSQDKKWEQNGDSHVNLEGRINKANEERLAFATTIEKKVEELEEFRDRIPLSILSSPKSKDELPPQETPKRVRQRNPKGQFLPDKN